ncbi:MAG: N-acetyltransferase DgcN [Pseudomonadota bacterium]|nr:N-acetyltransferase DgcN [Pseudomonadota bacterium]
MNLPSPYLLFIGNATDPLSIKMAKSAADWSPEMCVGEFSLPGCSVTTGLPALTIEEGAQQGAKAFVLGFANSGGVLDPSLITSIVTALEAGMDIINGLHDKLADIPEVAEKAQALNRRLIDIRHPTTKFKTGTGVKRPGKRLLTVGTDCSVGKMYTTLSLARGIQSQGMKATFRATGQSGILVAGEGVAVDCVVSDFISGSVEALCPANDEDHWDLIEGQGSLYHPAFAGVSLGLLHGSQPDALVICHALNRDHMRALPGRPLPSLEQVIEMNLTAARITNPDVKVIGVSVNTSSVSEDEALAYCKSVTEQLGLPCVDPIRHGVGALVEALE